jgi:hypothetical protein
MSLSDLKIISKRFIRIYLTINTPSRPILQDVAIIPPPPLLKLSLRHSHDFQEATVTEADKIPYNQGSKKHIEFMRRTRWIKSE